MIQVYINNDFIPFTAKIYITRKIEGERDVFHVHPGETDTYSWDHVDPLMEAEPTITLPMDMAEALFLALRDKFDPDASQVILRKDYDSERARVDKLIDKVLVQGEINSYNVQKFIDTIRESQGMR